MTHKLCTPTVQTNNMTHKLYTPTVQTNNMTHKLCMLTVQVNKFDILYCMRTLTRYSRINYQCISKYVYTMDTCSILCCNNMTISQFNSPCNYITSFWSTFVYNTHTAEIAKKTKNFDWSKFVLLFRLL